jgi:hypothetical protein
MATDETRPGVVTGGASGTGAGGTSATGGTAGGIADALTGAGARAAWVPPGATSPCPCMVATATPTPRRSTAVVLVHAATRLTSGSSQNFTVRLVSSPISGGRAATALGCAHHPVESPTATSSERDLRGYGRAGPPAADHICLERVATSRALGFVVGQGPSSPRSSWPAYASPYRLLKRSGCASLELWARSWGRPNRRWHCGGLGLRTAWGSVPAAPRED